MREKVLDKTSGDKAVISVRKEPFEVLLMCF